MSDARTVRRCLLGVAGWLAVLATGGAAAAQGTGGPVSTESSVGYIDNAIPGNIFRQRFDAAYTFSRATRAEFFYAQTQPGGPGLPSPELNIDYQDLSTYLEYAPVERFSIFAEVPERFLNPDVNANAAGFGDVSGGFKYAFLYQPDWVASVQLRAWAPTGEADRGLGNRHVSLEPALLFFNQLNDRLALAGELRYWIPIGGTDFAGSIVRYGLGFQYDLACTECYTFMPVVEFVGWTVLDGKESVVFPSGGTGVLNAAGDTILNVKVGMRVKLGERADVYGGYGRPLTGERWYSDTFRLELRLLY